MYADEVHTFNDRASRAQSWDMPGSTLDGLKDAASLTLKVHVMVCRSHQSHDLHAAQICMHILPLRTQTTQIWLQASQLAVLVSCPVMLGLCHKYMMTLLSRVWQLAHSQTA